MTEEELQASFVLDESEVILNTTIPKNITDRIKTVCQSFSINTIQVMFAGENASLVAKTQSKDQFATFYSNILVDRPMDCYSNVLSIGFTIDHDTDVSFKMYNVRDNIVINKLSTTVLSTNITTYTRGSLVNDNE